MTNSTKDPLTRTDILQVIRRLSHSQGSYGRMLRDLEELENDNPDSYLELMRIWESKRFMDAVDFILFVEG